MQYFQKLNLPYPLKDQNSYNQLLEEKKIPASGQTLNCINDYDTGLGNYQLYVNQDLIKIFDSLNLTPFQVIVFGWADKKLGKTFVHSDIILNEEGNWEDFPAAINWELVPSYIKMDWYDPTGIESFDPNTANYAPYQFRGRKYGAKLNKDAAGLTLLESYIATFGTPALLRTDIPHQVKSISLAQKRMCLSIRFPKYQIASYADALEIFKDHII